jgi:DNA polymerase-3 subunit chi
MTAVEFHFNAPDKLAYACRLLRKAVAQGAQVTVTAPVAALRELDTTLWTFAQTEFLPHCLEDAPQSVLRSSPVVLCQDARSAPHHAVLVNLGEEVPDGFERFERLIEVVALDESDRAGARRRWLHYKGRGYALERKDLELKEGR